MKSLYNRQWSARGPVKQLDRNPGICSPRATQTPARHSRSLRYSWLERTSCPRSTVAIDRSCIPSIIDIRFVTSQGNRPQHDINFSQLLL